MRPSDRGPRLREIYDRLWAAYGPQHWWPAETPTEVVIGAILTQNTAWKNVERAITNLRRAECLTWDRLRELPERRLADIIRPAGTYRVKAARLKMFVDTLFREYLGSLDMLLDGDVTQARERLLAIKGIGEETADAIVLYAGGGAVFLGDAYTRRILRRHYVVARDADYDRVKRLVEAHMPPDARVYNEFHALLVRLGKQHCRAKARCEGCPLADFEHDANR